MEFITDISHRIAKKMSIAIDFDGVIHVDSNPDHSISGKTIDGAKEAIDQLKQHYKIIIYSARINPEFGIDKNMKEIKQFLDDKNIYFDEVAITKPVAKYYIDDKAVHFSSWDNTLSQLEMKKEAIAPITRKRRDQHEMTYTNHDPSIDEPTLDNNNLPEQEEIQPLEALWS